MDGDFFKYLWFLSAKVWNPLENTDHDVASECQPGPQATWNRGNQLSGVSGGHFLGVREGKVAL